MPLSKPYLQSRHQNPQGSNQFYVSIQHVPFIHSLLQQADSKHLHKMLLWAPSILEFMAWSKPQTLIKQSKTDVKSLE